MDDEVVKTLLGRAYWMPVPLTFLRAAGAVTAQWGYFEMQFAGFISFLSRKPELVGKPIPRSFDGKAKLLRQLARAVFPHCPTLVEKICEYSTRANDTGKKRNVVVHGFWFDMTHFEPQTGVTIMTEPDGTGDFYSVTLLELEKLSEKIVDLKIEGIQLMFAPTSETSERLTPDELSALRDYQTGFPGDPPASPIHRDPNRKGSAAQPEPFEA